MTIPGGGSGGLDGGSCENEFVNGGLSGRVEDNGVDGNCVGGSFEHREVDKESCYELSFFSLWFFIINHE
ncbi:hypothetical protein TSUD_53350 [Trifolium subterraneum]|uniref:Uncharacterized protein n=1 Tax=Trifolium subterraneum TaxID=3900 RepID=A0A2Z6NQ57_TRISU|nr:hypothetical protein TSUD_53350 [Trifolium subterraneum]